MIGLRTRQASKTVLSVASYHALCLLHRREGPRIVRAVCTFVLHLEPCHTEFFVLLILLIDRILFVRAAWTSVVEERLSVCCCAKDLAEASLSTTTGLFCNRRGGGRHEDWKALRNDALRADLLAHDPTDRCKGTGWGAFMVGVNILERWQINWASDSWRDMA